MASVSSKTKAPSSDNIKQVEAKKATNPVAGQNGKSVNISTNNNYKK